MLVMRVFRGDVSFGEQDKQIHHDLFERTFWEPGAKPDHQASADTHGTSLEQCYRIAGKEAIPRLFTPYEGGAR